MKLGKFISVLGKSNYVPCNYGQYKNVNYIQEALVRKYKDKISDVIIFATKEAIKSNWLGEGSLKNKFDGLQEQGIEFNYKIKEIPLGASEDEVWEIFDIIVEEINEGDSLYLDITHGFRFQPMLIMSIMNYVKLIKNVTVESIEYGMFEILGTRQEVEIIPVEERNAPIVDLTLLDQLNDWVVATDSFLTTGSVTKIDELTKNEIGQVLALTKGRNEFFQNLKSLVNNLKDFYDCVNTSRGNKLNETIINILKNLKDLDEFNQVNDLKNKRIKPFLQIIDKIYDKFKGFSSKDKSDIANYFMVLNWCNENNFIQQGLVILRENIISFIIFNMGYDYTINDYRFDVSKALSYLDGRKKREIYKNKEFYLKVKEFISNNYPYLPKLFSEVGDTRNDISHFGLTKCPISNPNKFKDKLKEFIEQIEPLVSNL
ncbi:TIGR02221 family CRISPR-associated protein [Halothermothrix orenii]|uniref:CRISPR-associated protein, TM1812 family n=1 Tax=Halothermothrix orenii (strain H 168 / OCM 544 / DSM 9562) TaxID=373903 RepID=B8CY90_HALOH|nr:TIGR02221 family CRISPR-associated protein [Halothermothrix orenii]ACL70259.1 CRISPR-associated protein, TM1812 family [Halothermothrix orenii H 168]